MYKHMYVKNDYYLIVAVNLFKLSRKRSGPECNSKRDLDLVSQAS